MEKVSNIHGREAEGCIRRTLPFFFFFGAYRPRGGFSNGTPLFLSRKNGRRSNVNLPLAYGGTGCSREHACPSAHAQRHTRACVGSQRAWAMLWHATRPLHVRTGNVGRRGRGGEIQKGNKRWIAALARTHTHARVRETQYARIR